MQKLQLSIPEPCHENWQNMTPTQQGRFCNACAKEVVDFSTMTDMQVLNYFTNMTHEKVCGRALPEQLDRAISRPEPPKKRLFWYWNYIAMFFMFFVKGNNAAGQTSTKPATELSPSADRDIRGKIAVTQVSRIITGKITDTEGNPVPFASVMIKGTKTGVSADANGAYSLRVASNAILIIRAASFTETEIPTGNGLVFNTIMKQSGSFLGEVVVVGIWAGNTDEYYGPLDRSKRVAVIQVKDETTGKVIPQANLLLQTAYKTTDTVFTDKKGMYKLKGITEYDRYSIKVMAAGFEPAEFTISEHDFAERKKEWEVLLRKEKIKIDVSAKDVKLLGGMSIAKSPIYIVDGEIFPDDPGLKPEDVEDQSVLQGPEAMALLGPYAANGAVLITTRKAKEIQLKDVMVTGEFGGRRRTMGAMVSGMSITVKKNDLNEKIMTFKTLLTDSIKIFPNPVQPNSDFSVRLKLKQPGTQYSMLITDAVGKVLLQQKISAVSKEHTEKIAADGRWSAGIYYIRILDTQNNLVSKSSFIYR